MAKRTYVVDVHTVTFPFGQEYVDNKSEPLGQGVYSNVNNSIQVVDFANAIPTPEGMASFFGNTPLNLPALGVGAEHVFTYKDNRGNNTLIALGEYGAFFSQDGVTWDMSQATVPATTVTGGGYTFTITDKLTEPIVGELPATLTITDTTPVVPPATAPAPVVIPIKLPMHVGTSAPSNVSLDVLLTADAATPLPTSYTATITYTYLTVTYNFVMNLGTNTIGAHYINWGSDIVPMPIKKAWSKCVLNRRLYVYREGAANILRMNLAGTAWEVLTPTFVTATNIAGIFSARGRLGLWDIAGAIYTSSDIDPMDFTPSVSTLANVVTPTALQGKIVSILGQPEGFMVYSTSSILEAIYTGGTEVFKYITVSDSQGVLSPLSCVAGMNGQQYVLTGEGVYLIKQGKLTPLDARLNRYVQTSTGFPRLDYLQNRYLAVSMSPAIPTRVVSKIDSYAPTTLPGIAATPGTPAKTFKGFTVPSKTMVLTDIPPIYVPARIVAPSYSQYAYTIPDIIIPPIVVPPIPAGQSYTAPDITVPAVHIPAVTKTITIPRKQGTGQYIPNTPVIWTVDIPLLNLTATPIPSASYPFKYEVRSYRLQAGSRIEAYNLISTVPGEVIKYVTIYVAGGRQSVGGLSLSEANARAVFSTARPSWYYSPLGINGNATLPNFGLDPLRYTIGSLVATWDEPDSVTVDSATPLVFSTGLTANGVDTAAPTGLEPAILDIVNYFKALSNWQTNGFPSGEILMDYSSYGRGYDHGYQPTTNAIGEVDTSWRVSNALYRSSTINTYVTMLNNLGITLQDTPIDFIVPAAVYPGAQYSSNTPFSSSAILNNPQTFGSTSAELKRLTTTVMKAIKKAYLSKYIFDNGLTYIPQWGKQIGTLQYAYTSTGCKIWATIYFNIILRDGSTIQLPTDYNTTKLIGTGIGYTGPTRTGTLGAKDKTITITIPGLDLPAYTIPGYTIQGAKGIPGFTIPGYTIPGMNANGTIPGYTIPGAKIPGSSITYTRPGYTIPDIVIPAIPGLPAVPALTIPGGSFVAASGAAEPISTVYTRAVLYDEQLKSWGSCDQNFKALIDYSPINARSTNPITGYQETLYSYKNLAYVIGVLDDVGLVNLCTKGNPNSFIEIGDIGFSRSGFTKFLSAQASFTQESGSLLEIYGSRDGVTLYSPMTASVTSQNGVCMLYKVLIGKWFRARVSGEFELKHLEFSGEAGGKR